MAAFGRIQPLADSRLQWLVSTHFRRSLNPYRVSMSYFNSRQVQLSYFDHNEKFAEVLPVEGRIGARLSTGSVDDWYRLDLDGPIEWETDKYDYVLIRSRYADRIDDPEGTSVFVLVGKTNPPNDGSIIDVGDYDHVAWGWARVVNGR